VVLPRDWTRREPRTRPAAVVEEEALQEAWEAMANGGSMGLEEARSHRVRLVFPMAVALMDLTVGELWGICGGLCATFFLVGEASPSCDAVLTMCSRWQLLRLSKSNKRLGSALCMWRLLSACLCWLSC
jgi:hypothetical protein